MGDEKRPVSAHVVIGLRDSELEIMQALERGAVIAGGELGEAVLNAIDSVRESVFVRAMP